MFNAQMVRELRMDWKTRPFSSQSSSIPAWITDARIAHALSPRRATTSHGRTAVTKPPAGAKGGQASKARAAGTQNSSRLCNMSQSGICMSVTASLWHMHVTLSVQMYKSVVCLCPCLCLALHTYLCVRVCLPACLSVFLCLNYADNPRTSAKKFRMSILHAAPNSLSQAWRAYSWTVSAR